MDFKITEIPIGKFFMRINKIDYANGKYLSKYNVAHKGSASVSKLKNVEGNICACCGRETIKSIQLSEMWSKITLPLSKLLQGNIYNKVKLVSPEIYDTLSRFAKKYPEDSLTKIVIKDDEHAKFLKSIEAFLIKRTDFNKCSNFVRGQMKKDKTMEILKISEIDLKPAPEVIENVKPLRKYMHDYRGEIFDELEILAGKYPDKKLSEILKIPEVYEHYIEATYNDAMNFAKKRDYHLNNADEIVLKNCPDAKDELDKIHTEICSIYPNVHDHKRVIYLIQNLYRGLLNKFDLLDCEDKIMHELSQMPVNLYTRNSFLSYARMYYSDGAIVNYMVRPFMETIEHIIPISNGGQDSIDNVIMFCRDCNHSRAWHPYSEFIKYHPEMLKNGLIQARLYSEGIINGTITSDLRDYPIKIAKTWKFVTDGMADLDVSDYIRSMTEKGEKLYENT